MTKQSWVDRFFDEFGASMFLVDLDSGEGKECLTIETKKLKAFIKDLLAQRDAEIVEMIDKYIGNCKEALKNGAGRELGSGSGAFQLNGALQAFNNLKALIKGEA